MRIRSVKILLICIFFVNFPVLYYTWKFLLSTTLEKSLGAGEKNFPKSISKYKNLDRVQAINKHIRSTVTIIIRDFYHFDNDLKASINSILNVVPNVKIFVVYDKIPYPPLEILNTSTFPKKVSFFTLEDDLNKVSLQLFDLIKTPYTLLIPDSIRINGKSIFQKIFREVHAIEEQLKRKKAESIFVIPFVSNNKQISACESIDTNLAEWTIRFTSVSNVSDCDIFVEKHAILCDSTLVKSIKNSLMSPFPDSLYIRVKSLKIKVCNLIIRRAFINL